MNIKTREPIVLSETAIRSWLEAGGKRASIGLVYAIPANPTNAYRMSARLYLSRVTETTLVYAIARWPDEQ